MNYIKAILIILLIAFGLPQEELDIRRHIVLTTAESKLGFSYGMKELHYDCSGFVSYCFNAIEEKLPRSSRSQYRHLPKVARYQAMPGDLIFFTGRDASKKIVGHVGIIHHKIENTIYFIHASNSKGIIISSTDEEYYKSRYVGCSKVIK